MIKIPLSWLKDYVDLVWTPDQIAAGLTLRGLEVEGIVRVGEEWDKVLVGEVVSTANHPNADRLAVVQISDGQQTYQVITGAKNLKAGDKCPLALPGAKLIDGHKLHDEGRIEGALKKRRSELPSFSVKTGKMRGVESNAVACAELELGISEEFNEIMVLDRDAPVGAPLQEVLGDTIIELDISPNLGRALSIFGVAREVAAMTGQTVRFPEISIVENSVPVEEKIKVTVEAPDLCPRFTMMVIEDVQIGSSPTWMQRRLRATDQPVINNIVDITNYVMLEFGQPLHAFDYDHIKGKHIIVRRAQPGEKLETIDHVVRDLNPEIMLVADAERSVAIAGVMGGVDSEVSDTTTTVALEGAHWDAFNIRATARGMFSKVSEAAKRFERTVDIELTTIGVRRGIQFMQQYAGGRVCKGMIDEYPEPKPLRKVDLPLVEIPRLLGINVAKADVIAMLEKLDFQMQDLGDTLRVTVPSYRNDVTIKADLVEEVARMHGYDKIPETMLEGNLPPQQTKHTLLLDDAVRSIMIGCGLNEIISYALVSRESLLNVGYSDDNLVKITNPSSSEFEYMRPLMLPSMLKVLAENRRFNEQAYLFEIGHTYVPNGELATETRTLMLGMSGTRQSLSRFVPEKALEQADYFDLKGVVEVLFYRLNLSEVRFERIPEGENPTLHPGRAAAIIINGDKVGVIGEVHPKIADKFDLPASERVAVAEISLEKLLPLIKRETYRPVPRLQPISRDLAIMLPEETLAAQVEALIRQTGGSLLVGVTLFDIYRGKPIPEGKKSLAYRLSFQPQDRTMTDDEVTKLREKIEKRLTRELGAEFRG